MGGGQARNAYCLVRDGGGCEIRTREGLPPTRFPTMLTGVHRWPPKSATCADAPRAAVGERSRTEVNETTFETSPSCRSCRGAGAGGLLTLVSAAAILCALSCRHTGDLRESAGWS